MANPVKFLSGLLSDLENTPKVPGQVYFALYGNSGKIAFDVDSNTRVFMSGGGDGGSASDAEIAEYARKDILGTPITDYVLNITKKGNNRTLVVNKGDGQQEEFTLNYAGSASSGGAAYSAGRLDNYFATRQTSMDFNLRNMHSMFYTIASNVAVVGKPPEDSVVLTMPWDSSGYGAQLAIGVRDNPGLYIRGAKDNLGSSLWDSQWKQVAYTDGEISRAEFATKDSLGNPIHTYYLRYPLVLNGENLHMYRGDGNTTTIALPDSKVTQTSSETSDYRPLILGAHSSSDPASLGLSKRAQVYTASQFYAQPSTGLLVAKTFKGDLQGHASSSTSADTASKATGDTIPIVEKYIQSITKQAGNNYVLEVKKGNGATSHVDLYFAGSETCGGPANSSNILNGYNEQTVIAGGGDGKLRYSYNVSSTTPGIFPNLNNANAIITLSKHAGNHYSQLGFSSDGSLYYRNFNNSSLNSNQLWKKIAFTDTKVDNATKADCDSSGNNILSTYLAKIRLVLSDETNFSFRGVSGGGADKNDLISIPMAGDVAGLVSNGNQIFYGNKTFQNGILINNNGHFEDNSKFGINLQNSDIIGLNSIYMFDSGTDATKGIHFYKDGASWYTLWSDASGVLYLTNSHGLGQPATTNNVILHEGNIDKYEDYISKFVWVNGTVNGPVAKLTRKKGAEILSTSIPIATSTQSGVVTTEGQSFAGDKTFGDLINATGGILSSGTTFGTQLVVERVNGENGAAICFKNINGILGYIGMTAGPNEGLVRWNTNTAISYTIIDSDNINNFEDYITKFEWVNGTVAGPTASITRKKGSKISVGAIPTANGTQSGIVTTGEQTFSGDKTFTGSVILSKSTDLSGTSNNKPALIIGGDSSVSHLELDSDEIQAKSNNTTPSDLFLNGDGGVVHIGPGGLSVNGSISDSDMSELRARLFVSTLYENTHNGTTYIIGGKNTIGSEITNITIPNANGTLCGLITSSAQSFGGNKTFEGEVILPSSTTKKTLSRMIVDNSDITLLRISRNLNSNLGSNGYSLNYTENSNDIILLSDNGNAVSQNEVFRIHQNGDIIFANNITVNGTLYDKDASELRAELFISTLYKNTSNGTTCTIGGKNTVGAEITNITIPNASPTIAGLVTNDEQEFDGKKIFHNEIISKDEIGRTTYRVNTTKNVITTLLRVSGENKDLGDYGFSLKYIGVGGSNDNTLELFADNQKAASQLQVFKVWQDGNVRFGFDVTVGGTLYDKDMSELRARLFVSTLYENISNGTTYTIGGKNTIGSEITNITIPNASTTKAGLVTNAAQTFDGKKTFHNEIIASITKDMTRRTAFRVTVGGDLLSTVVRMSANGKDDKDYGFSLKYHRDKNTFHLYADNEQGSQVQSIKVYQNGDIDFGANINLGANLYDSDTSELRAKLFISTLYENTHTGTEYIIGGKNTVGAEITNITIPNASDTLCGLVTNSEQTFAGKKIFNNELEFPVTEKIRTVMKVLTNYSETPILRLTSKDDSQNFDSRGFTLTYDSGNLKLFQDIIQTNNEQRKIFAIDVLGDLTIGARQIFLENALYDRDASELRAELFISTLYKNTSNGTTYTIGGKNTVGAEISNITIPNASPTIAGLVTNEAQTFDGKKTFNKQIVSSVSTGTAPFAVSSTTVVTNLNADCLDGYHGSSSSTANTYVLRDNNNYVWFNYINSSTLNSENPTISQIIVTNGTDGYYRKASVAHLCSALYSTSDSRYIKKSGDTLDKGTTQIQRAGSSVSWYQGRSNAMIKINSYSGYNAIYSMKTTNGDWSCGVHTGNTLYWTYISDSNFNSNTNTIGTQMSLTSDGTLTATKVKCAVWNDYAEYRKADSQEPGYVMFENGDDSLSKTFERLQHFSGVVSDTFGFAEGKTEEANTPMAVAGRVLVYPYQDRNNYKPGDCVCAAPGGTVDIMTREEIINYPDRIVGTVSCVPTYENWGTGNVKVNGRIWIKVR